MKINMKYEIVDVADEHLAVPVDDKAVSFKGVIVLTDAAAYLLKNMKATTTKADLIKMLIDEYDIDEDTASYDVDAFIQKLVGLGVITG